MNPTRLSDSGGLLKAVAALIVPKVNRSVVPAAHSHSILVDRDGIDWGIMAGKIA